ncbi:MAG: hypothetical protein U9R64_10300 [Pseudomonadota bacterium]|nr:hypothetical protein [Pseudomonadota bacterium]
MAFGLDITIPTGVDDTTLPYADDDDALLVPGSLLLIDPAHSVSPVGALPALAPFGQTPVPNIAWKHLADILGSGTATTLANTFFYDSAVTASANRFEKSGKGGIHGIISQQNNNANFQGAFIRASVPLTNFLFTNRGHAFYFSRWSRVTRPGSNSVGATKAALWSTQGTVGNDYLFKFLTTGNQPAAGAAQRLGGQSTPGPNVADAVFDAIGVQGFTGAAPSSSVTFAPANWGTTAPDAFSGRYNVQQSSILYRTYLEDLTISGRSYADVEAIDRALFDLALGNGGRYANDSFTSPAVLP